MSMAREGWVITAGGRAGTLRELWDRRGLLFSFTLKELQVRYRQAALGVAWAVLQPLALMAITTLVFHRVLAVDTGSTPYPVFVFAGLVPWTYFHTAVSAAVPSLVSNADLVRKIHFPREALPLSHLAAALVDLGIGLVLWVGLLVLYGVPLSPALLHVLHLLALLVVAAAGPALWGAAVNVRFRDVKHALPLLLQFLFFATPIVYAVSSVPASWRWVFSLNPLTAVVEGLRACGIQGRAPDVRLLAAGWTSALVVLVFAWILFHRADRRFADEV